jgi:Zn-dependent peptidase ImmA (M78 family)
MSDKIQQPVLSYEQIRERADDFLKAHNPQMIIPVPIENIAEFSMGINIIPIPGLQKLIDVEGFISSDFSSITVDQFVMEERETRYRFTIAHEIGHLCCAGSYVA